MRKSNSHPLSDSRATHGYVRAEWVSLFLLDWFDTVYIFIFHTDCTKKAVSSDTALHTYKGTTTQALRVKWESSIELFCRLRLFSLHSIRMCKIGMLTCFLPSFLSFFLAQWRVIRARSIWQVSLSKAILVHSTKLFHVLLTSSNLLRMQ